MLDLVRWDSHADEWRQSFQTASPYPHLILENIVHPQDLATACHAWPTDGNWRPSQRGKRSMRENIPGPLATIIRELNSNQFVARLAALTGIGDLTPDYELSGAGLHETAFGGNLPLHVDFNRLGELYRRLNVLLFVNVDWSRKWRGNLELVDDPRQPVQSVSIPPTFGRMVIAESSDRSWHGHPAYLKCPEERQRRSIALYYYSRTPHESYKADHTTKYIRKPQDV